jgi:hypothetical protein
MYEMNEAERALVEALRSGEYEQGAGFLETYGEMKGRKNCCLGVGCRIYPGNLEVQEGEACTFFDNDNAHLPPSVKEWLGWDTDAGYLNEPVDYEGRSYCSLIDLNDAGMHFNEIAAVIESGAVTRAS